MFECSMPSPIIISQLGFKSPPIDAVHVVTSTSPSSRPRPNSNINEVVTSSICTPSKSTSLGYRHLDDGTFLPLSCALIVFSKDGSSSHVCLQGPSVLTPSSPQLSSDHLSTGISGSDDLRSFAVADHRKLLRLENSDKSQTMVPRYLPSDGSLIKRLFSEALRDTHSPNACQSSWLQTPKRPDDSSHPLRFKLSQRS